MTSLLVVWVTRLSMLFADASCSESGSATADPNHPDSGCFQTNLPVVNAGPAQLQHILQILFGILGTIAVLMIVLAGLRYILAQGNPQDVSKAKNTIIYAIIGLVVAIFAEAIVTFVLDKL